MGSTDGRFTMSGASNIFPVVQCKGIERNKNFMLLLKDAEERRWKNLRERSNETLSEEWFVDKSRNIGVTDGGKDLKLQVKKKKLKRNLRANGTQTDYKSLCKISKRLMKSEDYKNSLNYLNMAINVTVGKNNEDTEAYILRSQCKLRLCLYEGAATDASMALAVHHNSKPALKAKAEALYQMDDLELALVYYERIIRMTPDCEWNQILKRRNYCADKITKFLENYEFQPKLINRVLIEITKTRDNMKTPSDFGELQKDVEFLCKLTGMESYDRNKPRVNKCQDIKALAGETLQQLKHENDLNQINHH